MDLFRLWGTLVTSTAKAIHVPKAFLLGTFTCHNSLFVFTLGVWSNRFLFSANCSATGRMGLGSRGCGFQRTAKWPNVGGWVRVFMERFACVLHLLKHCIAWNIVVWDGNRPLAGLAISGRSPVSSKHLRPPTKRGRCCSTCPPTTSAPCTRPTSSESVLLDPFTRCRCW